MSGMRGYMQKCFLKKVIAGILVRICLSPMISGVCFGERTGGFPCGDGRDLSGIFWKADRVQFSRLGDGLYSLDASDVSPVELVHKISRFFRVKIIFDSLPDMPVTIHTSGTGVVDFVASVARLLGHDYASELVDGCLRIFRRIPSLGESVLPPRSESDLEFRR